MKGHQIFKAPLLLVAILALWLSSCKTSGELPRAVAKPMSTNKLLKRVEQNAFDYDYFSIKRINCNFSSTNSRATFKIDLKAKKDEKILVSIKKMNIPVGRVLLTPDSVKYVNYIDRNYFYDDYSFLSKFLHIDIDFGIIQSIISNNAFSYRNDPKDKDFKTFASFIENGMHLLQSEKTKKIFKLDEKDKPQKLERRFRRLDDDALIVQKMYFNPGDFALTRLQINDKTNNRNMNLVFDDFVTLKNKEYPGAIEMNFLSEIEQIRMRIRMAGFSTDKISSIDIKIPQKYEQIHVSRH